MYYGHENYIYSIALLPNNSSWVTSGEDRYGYLFLGLIADPHYFNADPDPDPSFQDPSFYVNVDPDPNFNFNTDPDPAPDQRDAIANLRPLVYGPSRAPF